MVTAKCSAPSHESASATPSVIIPDPYLYALLLTFITAAGAWVFTATAPAKIVTAWYDGIWAILAFAMQMALILATGVALAEAPLVKRLLQRVAAVPKAPGRRGGYRLSRGCGRLLVELGIWPCGRRAPCPRSRQARPRN